MRLTSISKDISDPVRELTEASFVDGLDISLGNYRAHSSFIRVAKILLEFETIRMKCIQDSTQWSTLGNKRQAFFKNYNVIRYFSGKGDTWPEEATIYWRYSLNDSTSSYPIDPVGDALSTDNVEREYRPFKDVYIGNDGLKMTFTNESQQCFGPEGVYENYIIEVSW